jgi:hypothetical protein
MIFSGSVGGSLGALAPLISTVLGVKAVPITYHVAGKRHSVEIPNVMHAAVQPLPSLDLEWECSSRTESKPQRIVLNISHSYSPFCLLLPYRDIRHTKVFLGLQPIWSSLYKY